MLHAASASEHLSSQIEAPVLMYNTIIALIQHWLQQLNPRAQNQSQSSWRLSLIMHVKNKHVALLGLGARLGMLKQCGFGGTGVTPCFGALVHNSFTWRYGFGMITVAACKVFQTW